MTPRSRLLRHPLLWLCAVQAFSFGLFTFHLGFYHDDWPFLEMMKQGGSFWGAVKVMAASGGYWGRPVEILQFPLFYLLGGFHPWAYHLLIVALQALESVLLFLFLDKLLGWRGLALGAAIFAATFPDRAVIHFWFANSPQTVTQVLALASLLAHLYWLERRESRWLWAGQSAYLLGMLSYESCTFIPLFLAGGLFARHVLAGKPSRAAAAATARDLWPYAATLTLALSWQWAGLRLILGVSNSKSQAFAFSWAHLVKAYGAGFECIANRVLHICVVTAPEAFRRFLEVRWGPLRMIYAWIAGTLVLAVELAAMESEDASSRCPFVAIMAILGGFVGAYAPYALSGTYMPQAYGIMSRTNGAGAWVGGLLWAYLWAVLARAVPRAKIPLAFLLLGAFTWANWANGLQWVRSWSVQRDILSKAGARAAGLPPNSSVLLQGSPSYIGWAVVFDAPYDFDAALRLTTGRPDLRGNIWSPQLRFAKDRVVQCYDRKPLKEYPYDRLYLYHYDQDRIEPAAKPASAAILLQSPAQEDAPICGKP